jgi:ferredoxin
MAFVVTEPCVGCRYTDCVETCPVDAFRAGPDRLVIDPVECIDCGACVPACPVDAIFLDQDVPAKWSAAIAENAALAMAWPPITRAAAPLKPRP